MNAPTEVVADDLDFVVVDMEAECAALYSREYGRKAIDSGVTCPASWAAPELRAQQAALRKEKESVFALSAADKRQLQSRPIQLTLFVPKWPAFNSTLMTRQQRRRATADAEKRYQAALARAPKLRANAWRLGFVVAA